MKNIYVAGAVVLLASQFLGRAYAVELCESQDYYNLVNASKCTLQYKKTGNKGDPRDSMFEIMKNYPFESKDAFAKLLQRKVELIGNYKTQEQGKRETEKVISNISMLEQTKKSLSENLKMVNVATRDNWVSVRDQARKALEEAANRLREVE